MINNNNVAEVQLEKKYFIRGKNEKINLTKKIVVIFVMIIIIIALSFFLILGIRPLKKVNHILIRDFREKKIDKNLYWNNQVSLEINKIKNEIKELSNINISFTKKADFIKRETPKISLIITLYNQEKNIKSIYYSIQKQEMKDIEIIFVDDASNDTSSNIVKELMEKDKRIVYLKNDVNKRAFYSRNRGILEAKGEFILIIDPDDLLINNILFKAYKTAKKYDLDIVQFYIMIGYRDQPNLWSELKYKGGILEGNSEIRNIFYYGISRNLWDKLVRREIYVKSVHFMKKEFYNENYRINDDDTSFFGLVHVANTYGFLEQIGYFYILKPLGSYDINNAKNANEMFRSIFNNMKYFYIQSDENTLEKSLIAYEYFKKSMINFEKFISYVTDGFDFIFEVFDLYLKSPYLDKYQKNQLNEYKNKFFKTKEQLKNNTIYLF